MKIFDVFNIHNGCFIGWTLAKTKAEAVNNVRYRVYGRTERNDNFYAVERVK